MALLPHLKTVSLKRCACVAAVACLAVCLVALPGCGNNDTSDRAAEFGDTVITEQEVSDYTQQFREQNGYESDTSWSLYLGEQGLTGKTWREEAIRSIVKEKLVNQKAEELGITADEDTVNASIATLKENNDIAEDDADAWQSYLDARGMTEEELRASYELSSVEQQLITQDANTATVTDDEIQEYIDENLRDTVTRRFSVISFALDDKASADAALAELKGLSGEELTSRFNELAEEQASKLDGYSEGDLSWDLGYSLEDIIDGDDLIKLQPGDLYAKVAKTDTCYQLYLCTDRFVFPSDAKVADVEDEDLLALIKATVEAQNWGTIIDDYLNQLVTDANVQVYEMPEGLAYDLTPYTEYKDAAQAYGNNE